MNYQGDKIKKRRKERKEINSDLLYHLLPFFELFPPLLRSELIPRFRLFINTLL